MKKIVALTGAGISAESGLKTFRDSGGLWEGHDPKDVATPEAWEQDRELVLRFYNERREGLLNSQPNSAHKFLAELEHKFQTQIITQNVDDLHERAGSKSILHLHGELLRSRSTENSSLTYPIDGPHLNLGDTCELGSQLRPDIVWFGEAVPKMTEAVAITKTADAFLVIGTSLQVYPAASLIDYTPPGCPIYLIDPAEPECHLPSHVHHIKQPATTGVLELQERLSEL